MHDALQMFTRGLSLGSPVLDPPVVEAWIAHQLQGLGSISPPEFAGKIAGKHAQEHEHPERLKVKT